MEKLRQELDAAIPFDCITPSIEQVKLPYLNMIIKETLRMHGPGFGTFRYCSTDTEVEGVVLPANTTLALWNPQGWLIWFLVFSDDRQLTFVPSAPRHQSLGSHSEQIQTRPLGRRCRSTQSGLLFPFLIRAAELSGWVKHVRFHSDIP